jgi:hypothetical protein
MTARAIDEPLRVLPFIVAPRHDRGRQRRQLEAEPVRVGLQQQLAKEVRANLELVVLADLRARDEDLPHADGFEFPHRMEAAVPPVEVADDADALGIGRPDCEVHPDAVADAHRVRAELVVDPRVLALCEQVGVVFGDDAAVTIRVVDLDRLPAGIRDAQPIVERLGAGKGRFEDAGRMALHRRHAARVPHLDVLGRRLVGPDDQAARLAVRTEHGEWIGMTRAGQRVEGLVDRHGH